MGLYWQTIICRGFRIAQLINSLPNIPKEWIIRDTSGITFVCSSMSKSLGSIDPRIDPHDVSQGFMIMNKLRQFVNISSTHFEISDDDQRQLKSIHQHYQAILPQNEKIGEIDNFVVEYMWSTLDPETTDKLCFQKFLSI
ncbi:unnamed protein product [Adineta steineri]|uniref:Uncharacterized protein n=1 Tax=Adineta steineri TaxID=433720 RepID=A0A813RNL1_9BILA|nr:unnamed protein product [Adineta steineri]CAF3890300.1 unnamed protein product [Adineta steineri]